MSLLSFLDDYEVKQKMKEFPCPKISLTENIKIEPQTKDYGIVGTAFDYLCRFYVEYINKNIGENREWVATVAFNRLKKVYSRNQEYLLLITEEYAKAIHNYNLFKCNGIYTDDLVKSSLFLAVLDLYIRTGRDFIYVYRNFVFIDSFLHENSEFSKNINDLKKLISHVPKKIFTAKKIAYLNPTFGKASNMVGGADADIIIDRTLIDIKVTKNLKLTREYYNQLLGYYILSIINGNQHKVNHIAIYFARHGYFWKIPISQVGTKKKFEILAEWVLKMAKEFNLQSLPPRIITIGR
ncbi:MAG: hypothetical protein H0X33_11400 [Taibaiella sp.]|nr:hypothetical protein [Taibaiella sp.]